jgi:hypothetical protein
VVFYDTREDPLNQAARVYAAISRTGGESFEPNHPVADVPSNMTAANPYRYLGNYLEYIGVATGDCASYVVWTDNRHQWPVYLGGALCNYYFDRVRFETTPPEITCPAGLDVECDGPGGMPVTDPRFVAFVNSCVASDDCDSGVFINWSSNYNVFALDPPVFPPGNFLIQFHAYDTAGNSSYCDTYLNVLDTVPPAFDVTLTPDVLWPPDHRWVDIHASVAIQDECTPRPDLWWMLWSVTSEDPPDAEGGGATTPDIDGVEL